MAPLKGCAFVSDAVNAVPLTVVEPPSHCAIEAQRGHGPLQTCSTRSPQLCPAGHDPQSTPCPHPSPTTPQYLPNGCWQTRGKQSPLGGMPHTFGSPPPPQRKPGGQLLPQSTVSPQPPPILPQN